MVGGKAKLIREDYCDGSETACRPARGAISFEKGKLRRITARP
jgi:hypothetical protein